MQSEKLKALRPVSCNHCGETVPFNQVHSCRRAPISFVIAGPMASLDDSTVNVGADEPLGPGFAKWWSEVRSDYKSHESETVARAAWVIAWNVGRRAALTSPSPAPSEPPRDELFKAIQEVCAWEQDYRTRNNLGTKPPHCFVWLAEIAARRERIRKGLKLSTEEGVVQVTAPAAPHAVDAASPSPAPSEPLREALLKLEAQVDEARRIRTNWNVHESIRSFPEWLDNHVADLEKRWDEAANKRLGAALDSTKASEPAPEKVVWHHGLHGEIEPAPDNCTCADCRPASEPAAPARGGVREALNALTLDNHYWSTRPCETCAAVTRAIGMKFGCDAFREKRAYAAKEQADG